MSNELNICIDPDYEKSITESRKKGLVSLVNFSGVGGTTTKEIKVNYKKTNASTVVDGEVNAFIIIEPDRDAGVASGYGGVGQTAASSIDLVAGLGGIRPIGTVNGEKVETSKNFETDSARIYISQYANIDEYFGLPEYKILAGTSKFKLDSSVGKSAIAAKADCIRIIGRENVRIVTSHLGDNSRETAKFKGGIEIIAGYDVPDKLHLPQPMVKGDNLMDLLKEMIGCIENVQATVNSFMDTQQKFNLEISNHTHQNGAAGRPTSVMINNKCIPLNLELINSNMPDILTSYAKILKINDL